MGDLSFNKVFQYRHKSLLHEDILLILYISSLTKEPKCYKNPHNPSCIDLVLTNSPYSFQNSSVIETGLSGFHMMTVTVTKTTYKKLKLELLIIAITNFFPIIYFNKCFCRIIYKRY